MTEMPNIGFDGEESGPIEVAQVTCAYHNDKVIEFLAERGALIEGEEWEKLGKINDEFL
jgi:hypothetical protein